MFGKIAKDERGVAFVLELLLVCLVLAALGFIGYRAYSNKSPATRTVSNAKVPTQAPKDLAGAHNAFGFDVLQTLSTTEGNKNVFISPPSVALALSMVYNGAKGDTKTAMAKTMQIQNLDLTQLNQESLGLLDELKKSDQDITLSIANSLWLKQGFEVKPDFLSNVKNYYQAEASSLDFENPSAAKTINDWVSKNTNGKISKIVDDTSDKEMLLVNATYFKGNWTTEFDKKSTADGTFTPTSGPASQRPFMERTDKLSYLQTADFQSVSLPYGKSQRFSMYVFLPNNLTDFTQKLNNDTWNQWMSQYQEAHGTILLPKFKLEYETSLIPTLQQLGMGTAFTGQADFGGIADTSLSISEVKHKTYLDVNEQGTEAAAATSVGVGITSARGSDGFYMNVNRPFFVAIRDNQTQELLFTGLIQNP